MITYTQFTLLYQPRIQGECLRLNNSYFLYHNQIVVKRKFACQDEQINLQMKFYEERPKQCIKILNYAKREHEVLIAMEQGQCSLGQLKLQTIPASIMNFIKELLLLVISLKETNISHNNLTQNNIIVTKDNRLKLTDFRQKPQNDEQSIAKIIIEFVNKQFQGQNDFVANCQKLHPSGLMIAESILSLTESTDSHYNTVYLCYGLIVRELNKVAAFNSFKVKERRSNSEQKESSKCIVSFARPRQQRFSLSKKKMEDYIKNQIRLDRKQIPYQLNAFVGKDSENLIRLNETCIYKGEINEQKQPCGMGIMIDEWKAEIQEGIFNGEYMVWGRQMHQMGERILTYMGYMKEGKKEGIGILEFDDGQLYKGEFKANKLDGVGIYYYRDGSMYDGQYKEGKKHGEGIYYFKNQLKYFEINSMDFFYRRVGQYENGEPKGIHLEYKLDDTFLRY